MTTYITEQEQIPAWMVNKHRALRGSDALKYPPKRERCHKSCTHNDYLVKNEARGHPCFLAPGHPKPCEFSSECKASRFFSQPA